MWRWYLNSKEAAVRKFQEVLDEIERNSPNPTYTCAVRMEGKGWYINWKKNMRQKDRHRKRQKKAQTKEEEQKERKRTVLTTKENDRYTNFRLSIYVRVNLFIIQKLTQFFTLTLYKSYCLDLFTCKPNTATGRYKSCPHNWHRLWGELELA